MYIERCIKGGVVQLSSKYAEADNPFLEGGDNKPEIGKDYTYLMYLDMNNLYGGAMSEPLPYGGFVWLTDEEIKACNTLELIKIMVHNRPDLGYLFEVDIECTHYAHDNHKDMPFLPIHEIPDGSKTKNKKLLLTLKDKKNYILHHNNLIQCLSHGLVLTKVHRVLQFDQKPFLKSYIDLNTLKRTQATNDFDRNLYKLLNNSVYGKTLQNQRKHRDVKLVTRWEGRYGAKKYIANHLFKSVNIFNENFVAIELNKSSITLNKPLFVGCAILEISKHMMFNFHYGEMKPRYGDNIKILYTDTDSLIYSIKCNNFYADMIRDSHLYDTSNYDLNNRFGIQQLHGKQLHKMKDENGGRVMSHFIGLSSKMYATKISNGRGIRRAKGVASSIVQDRITFDDYKNCLFNNKTLSFDQNLFKLKHHEMYTVRQNKIALRNHDDKRYLIPGTMDTVPHGHYMVEVYKELENEMRLEQIEMDLANEMN